MAISRSFSLATLLMCVAFLTPASETFPVAITPETCGGRWTRSFESEEIVQYHFSDINWAQGQNMSHLINCQCINGYLKTLVRKLKLVSRF